MLLCLSLLRSAARALRPDSEAVLLKLHRSGSDQLTPACKVVVGFGLASCAQKLPLTLHTSMLKKRQEGLRGYPTGRKVIGLSINTFALRWFACHRQPRLSRRSRTAEESITGRVCTWGLATCRADTVDHTWIVLEQCSVHSYVRGPDHP